ncbi:MAG: KpsF/GutQ family sugar-phosphate isomerase [Alphaproteobacteria bacterium]|nr:KpsF/GutQ family sugar-phosphate isomerase [Alphaproteobacteria bacterium]
MPTKTNSFAPSNQTAVDHALRVITMEIQGLQALAQSIGDAFVRAVEIIDSMKNAAQQNRQPGRLIVAGIGKSGHVARKIAATMASTGTPAYFVHAGEASHGDLGMVTENDVVLMLSNSGENDELSDLIHYTRRFAIPLIALTSNPAGTLAKHADICLLMPKVAEACPNGLAPTTSTTMMMAMGDALAVALLERMGLTAEQFRVFHPGGKLGRKLLKVSDLMIERADMAIVQPETTMDRALIALAEKNLGALAVTDSHDHLIGIFTDGDLKRHIRTPDFLTRSIQGMMSHNPKTIAADALAAQALEIMTHTPGHYLTSLLVTQGTKLVGMIRLQDCLKAGLA